MPKRTPAFSPRSIEEVFALYLSRELGDVEQVQFYVRLTKLHSLCLLLNALRAARKRKSEERVGPEDFLNALDQLAEEGRPA